MALRNIGSLITNRQLKTVERFDTIRRRDENDELVIYNVVGSRRMEAPDPELLDRLTLLGPGRINHQYTQSRESVWYSLINNGVSLRVARELLYESDPYISSEDSIVVKGILKNVQP